ncbi:hypothetical protein NV391_03510 [Companilactobacillus crustorum]|uniref:hypothetical protein n=1 Tax=Companilactobacillus crustorum TaxID=392416 RepID=UPI00237EDC04|nr:hypothetical protein [Companilactobacillus crustorum]WDT66280.1 hypothetical protein NV391_03510 [Companilactobacillus crustorum]
MTRDYNEIIDWMQLINKANTQLLHYRDMTIKANELATIQGMHIDLAHVSNSSNNNGTENKLIRYLEIKEQIKKIDKAVEPLNERQKQILILTYFNEYRASEYIIMNVMNLSDRGDYINLWDDALIDFANNYYDKDIIISCLSNLELRVVVVQGVR